MKILIRLLLFVSFALYSFIAEAGTLKSLNDSFWSGDTPTSEDYYEAMDRIQVKRIKISTTDARLAIIEVLKAIPKVDRDDIPMIDFHAKIAEREIQIKLDEEGISLREAFDKAARQLKATWEVNFGKGIGLSFTPIDPSGEKTYYTSPIFPDQIDREQAEAANP